MPPKRSSRAARVATGLAGSVMALFGIPIVIVSLVETVRWRPGEGPLSLAMVILFCIISVTGIQVTRFSLRSPAPDPLEEGNAERAVLAVAAESEGVVSEAAVIMKTALSLAQVRGAIDRLRASGLLEPTPGVSTEYRVLGLPRAPVPAEPNDGRPAPSPAPETLDALAERYGLTPAESSVLEQLAAGLSNEEIGERLFVSPATVRTHVYNIFKKLGVRSRMQAARLLAQRDA